MDIYIKNQVGKTIFVRIVSQPSKFPGMIYDLNLEVHSKRPKKTRDTVVILAILNGHSDSFGMRKVKSVSVDCTQFGCKLEYEVNSTANGKTLIEFKALN